MNKSESIVVQAMAATGLDQSGLSSLIGVSQSTISRWENGKAEPNALAHEVMVRIVQGNWTARRKRALRNLMDSGRFSEAITFSMGSKQ